jgi:plastocyanin
MPGPRIGSRRLRWTTVLLLARVTMVHASGTVEGRVPVAEVPPPLVLDARYAVELAGKVADPEPPVSVVYLEPDAPGAPPARAARPQLTQHGYQFDPGMLVVRTGTAVAFPNLDENYHSVFSYSDTKRFDLGRYLKDEEPPVVVFDKPGLVRLFCEIHEHMRGYVLVVDTPWFARSDREGRFRVADVPGGRYRLRVWVDPRRTIERRLEVRDGDVVRVDLTASEP